VHSSCFKLSLGYAEVPQVAMIRVKQAYHLVHRLIPAIRRRINQLFYRPYADKPERLIHARHHRDVFPAWSNRGSPSL
jgi:hypothetical protein